MKKLIILALSIAMIGMAGNGFAGDCTTKYPVLLLHGVALGDNTLGFDYFGRVPNYLRSYGAIVEGACSKNIPT